MRTTSPTSSLARLLVLGVLLSAAPRAAAAPPPPVPAGGAPGQAPASVRSFAAMLVAADRVQADGAVVAQPTGENNSTHGGWVACGKKAAGAVVAPRPHDDAGHGTYRRRQGRRHIWL